MKILINIRTWGNHHHPGWLDFFRIVLGIVLIWKGFSFMSTLSAFTALIHGDIGATVTASVLAHLVIVAHIIGGVLIALGTHTRLCCAFILPVPLLALMFSSLRLTIFTPYAGSTWPLLIFAALICFMIEGDGIWTIDRRGEQNVKA